MNRFGDCVDRIRYIREEILGLTQGGVAEQLGMTQSNISSVEIGRIKPSLLLILSFAITCKILPSWIILEPDEEPNIKIPSVKEKILNYNPDTILLNSKNKAEIILSFLPKRIKVAREECELSQKELSQKISLAQSNISAIERGTTIPHLDLLIEISNALEIYVDWFLVYDNAIITKLLLTENGLYNDHPLMRLVEAQLKELTIQNTENTEQTFIDGINLLDYVNVTNTSPESLRGIARLLLKMADIIENAKSARQRQEVILEIIKDHPAKDITTYNDILSTSDQLSSLEGLNRLELQKHRKSGKSDLEVEVDNLSLRRIREP